MARSLNSVQLIGNLTRDPELRYTPSGTAVATLGIATNRSWTQENGEKKEEVEYHRVIAWSKLGELCAQLLTKGSKVYVHGRLATRSWTGSDGAQKSTTEIVIDDMMVLSSKREGGASVESDYVTGANAKPAVVSKKAEAKEETKEETLENNGADEIAPDDIPF